MESDRKRRRVISMNFELTGDEYALNYKVFSLYYINMQAEVEERIHEQLKQTNITRD